MNNDSLVLTLFNLTLTDYDLAKRRSDSLCSSGATVDSLVENGKVLALSGVLRNMLIMFPDVKFPAI